MNTLGMVAIVVDDYDADATVEVMLSILGISPVKAKKLAHSPMPDLTK